MDRERHDRPRQRCHRRACPSRAKIRGIAALAALAAALALAALAALVVVAYPVPFDPSGYGTSPMASPGDPLQPPLPPPMRRRHSSGAKGACRPPTAAATITTTSAAATSRHQPSLSSSHRTRSTGRRADLENSGFLRTLYSTVVALAGSRGTSLRAYSR